MGKPTSQPEPAIHRFSHRHPLQLSNYDTQQTPNAALCSGCKLKASGWVYSCKNCNYFLHISCSKLPQQITHPFDHQNHVLSLFRKPIYSQGFFNCDACGKPGNGFSYHCGTCNIDLHTICATMPLLLTHQSHPHHLNLTFSPPYHNKSFSCDICKHTGSNEWLYRCSLCEFDAHLVCATRKKKAPVQTPIQQAQMQHLQAPRPSPTTYYQIPVAQYAQAPLLQNYARTNNNMNNNIQGALGPATPVRRRPQQQNVLPNRFMVGLFQGFGQLVGGAGGAGGDDAGIGDGVDGFGDIGGLEGLDLGGF